MRIAVKLPAWFLLAALAPLVIAGIAGALIFHQALETEGLERLRSLLESKVSRIHAFMREREGDAETLAHSPLIVDVMDRIVRVYSEAGVEASAYYGVDDEVRPLLTRYQRVFGYADVLLLSSAGDVVFSLLRGADFGANFCEGELRHTELGKAFDRARTLQATAVSDCEYYEPAGEPAAFIAAPILKAGELVGVLAYRLGNQRVYDVLLDPSGLGETGETVVVAPKDDRAVFVAPTRHDPDAAFDRHVAFGAVTRRPVQEAALGTKGSGSYVDYRGRRVFAAWRYSPYLRWGIVTKMDASELLGGIVVFRRVLAAVVAAAVIVALVLSLGLSRSIVRPIRKLRKGTAAVAGGDLEHRVGTSAPDEIGELSRAFDSMVQSLKRVTASRDELNREVAQRARAERNLRTAMSQLERSNRDIEQFAHSASHDLQEPLRKVITFGSLLDSEYGEALGSEGRHYVSIMRRATERMQALVSDLFMYTCIVTRARAFERVDLGRIVAEVLDDLSSRIADADAEIDVGELPTIDADAAQMQQLMQNLIENALKFRRENEGPRIRVYAEAIEADAAQPQTGDSHTGARCRIVVEDNGIGFEARHAERIFGVFQRLHGRHEYGGSGIGLAVCRRIAERHKGTITAQGTPGKGATFAVCLPTAHDEEGGYETVERVGGAAT